MASTDGDDVSAVANVRVRAEDVEKRFPGLLDAVLGR